MPSTITLEQLHQMMQECYALYQIGIISEKEYLAAIKPLDKAIDTLEMATLKECFALKEAFSTHSRVLKKKEVSLCSSRS